MATSRLLLLLEDDFQTCAGEDGKYQHEYSIVVGHNAQACQWAHHLVLLEPLSSTAVLLARTPDGLVLCLDHQWHSSNLSILVLQSVSSDKSQKGSGRNHVLKLANTVKHTFKTTLHVTHPT